MMGQFHRLRAILGQLNYQENNMNEDTNIVAGCLGRKAVQHDSRTLKLSNYLTTALAPPPPAKDWTAGQSNWGVMLNNSLGDCTIAGAAHAIQVWSKNSLTESTVTDADVLAAYEAWDGYNPANPATDNGGIELNVLNNWRNLGLAGHKLTAFASVTPSNQTEVQQAINLFGGVYIGVSLPITAQSQNIWDVDLTRGVQSEPGSWGGHCVFVVAYDQTGLTCITWGTLKKMTWAFWHNYCDEAYALFGQDWVNAKSMAPSGFDAEQLLADLSAIR